MQHLGIDHLHLLGERGFAGQRQGFGNEGRIANADQYLACGSEHAGRPCGGFALRKQNDGAADQVVAGADISLAELMAEVVDAE
jgi:hypothetical protein